MTMRWKLAAATVALGVSMGALAQTVVPLSFVQPLSPAAVIEVQQRLKQNGVYAGATDGVWGPDSQAALERFQQSRGLQTTSAINQATAMLLGLDVATLIAPDPRAASAAAQGAPLSAAAVRNIQARLATLGFYRGGADGVWGPNTQLALERFQRGQGLQPTGQVTPATAQALGLDASNLAAPRPR